MTAIEPHVIGTAVTRIDGPAKVTGTAPYAIEYPVERPLHLYPVQATIARGRPVCDATALDARGQRNGGIDEGGRRARLPQPA